MQKSVSLFPHVMIRTSGGATEDLDVLNFSETTARLEKLEELENDISKLSGTLNDQLYASIPSLNGNPAQKKLLNLKRTVFNKKRIKDGDYATCRAFLPAAILQEIEKYSLFQSKKIKLTQEAILSYDAEIPQRLEALKKLFQTEALKKGLVLSSQSLMDRIAKYVSKPKSEMRKKEIQTEQGLLKYLTRMYCKTSPFSTFTSLSSATTADNGQEIFVSCSKEEPEQVGHIRINNFLFAFIKILLTKSKKINTFIPIRVNPTLKIENKNYLYLINDNNNEAFQRIPLNPVLDLFIEILEEHPGGMPLDEVVQYIIDEDIIESGREELEAYLEQLIDVGFLEFNIGVSGIDTEWDAALIEKLEIIKQKHPLLAELISALKKLRSTANEYATAAAARRVELLKKAHGDIRSVCMKIHEDAGFPEEERRTAEEVLQDYRQKVAEAKKKAKEKEENPTEAEEENKEDKAEGEEKDKDEQDTFKRKSNTYFHFTPEKIFYEDATLDGDYVIQKENLNMVIQKLDSLLHSVSAYEMYFTEQAQMKQFFLKYYGIDKKVDLLNFYEDYFRQIKKPRAEYDKNVKKEQRELSKKRGELIKETGNEEEIKKIEKQLQAAATASLPDEFKVAANDQRTKVVEQWSKSIRETFQVSETSATLNFDLDKICNVAKEQAAEYLPDKVNTSLAAFMQFFEEKNEKGEKVVKAVLNASFQGYGKFASRFLHILHPDFTDELRKWNKALEGPGVIYAEDTDASAFNANLHPALLSAEICIPNGHNILPPERQIPVNDIEVTMVDGELTLIRKNTGERIYVFDLGFQGHAGRSELFQLMEKFTKAKVLYAAMLSSNLGISAEQIKQEKEWEKEKEDKQKKEERAATPPPEKITSLPRLTISDQIILRRKTWEVPKALLPLKNKGEADAVYFIRVNQWRKALDIPDEIFITVFQHYQRSLLAGGTKVIKAGRDDYKPQYINFSNPFLVNLFDKILRKVPISLKIQEMLPNSSQLFRFGKKRYVSEFLVHWYKQDAL